MRIHPLLLLIGAILSTRLPTGTPSMLPLGVVRKIQPWEPTKTIGNRWSLGYVPFILHSLQTFEMVINVCSAKLFKKGRHKLQQDKILSKSSIYKNIQSKTFTIMSPMNWKLCSASITTSGTRWYPTQFTTRLTQKSIELVWKSHQGWWRLYGMKLVVLRWK